MRFLFLFISILFFSTSGYAFDGNPKKKVDQQTIRKNVVIEAKKMLGIPYRFGGKSRSGMDCSGLTQSIFSLAGVKIDRTAMEQSDDGRFVSINELKAGDLVFFGANKNKIDHVAVVLRASQKNLVVIHSTSSGGVMIDDIFTSKYWKSKVLFGVDVMNYTN